MVDAAMLSEIPLLQGVGAEELLQLASVLRAKTVNKGTYIFCVNEPGSSMMFVLEGTVKVTLDSDDGKEIILAHMGPGDFFGEIALLTGEERSANVVAASECKLLILTEADFRQHLLANSGLALAMLRALALRLRAASAKIGDLALYDVYRRVARTLKSMGTPSELNGAKVYVIEDRPTHQELASMVGTSREMVTRALKGLEEDHCIEIDQRRIILRKVPI